MQSGFVYPPDFRISVLNRSFTLPSNLDELISFLEEREEASQLLAFIQAWYSESDCIKQFTSGSTGKPKKILLEKGKMLLSAKRTLEYFELDLHSRFLVCLSMEYIAGKMQLIRALVSGGEAVVVFPRVNPLEVVSGHFDFAAMVPLQFKSSIDEISRIKKLLLGGVSTQTNWNLPHNCQTLVYEGFGMTESYSHFALRSVFPTEENVFKAMQGVSLSLLPNGGLSITDRFLELSLETRDRISLVSKNEFRFLGRLDWVINSGGVKIQAEEIESVLSKYIENSLFVSGFPDEFLGERLVLLIESSDKSVSYFQSIVDEIAEFKPFHRPKEIRVIPEFIRSKSQKLLRRDTLKLLDAL